MSVKNVRAFFERVETDRALQAKLKALDRSSKKSQDAVISRLVKIAKVAGFGFTSKDFVKVRMQSRKVSRGELLKASKKLESNYQCGWPPCGTGGEAYTCPTSTW